MLPLVLLATSLACLVYAVALSLPFAPPPPRRAAWLAPVEVWLERELLRAGVRGSGRLLLWAMLLAALVGAWLSVPFQTPALTLLLAGACGTAPLQLVRAWARRRSAGQTAAEVRAKLRPYVWLTRFLFVASLSPLPYWAVTQSPRLRYYLEHPAAKWLLVWALASGLVVLWLPSWLDPEE